MSARGIEAVQGYATGNGLDETTYQQHKDAWERVKHIQGAILRKTYGYAQFTAVLDPKLTQGLTALEKLVLADGRTSPFGGCVEHGTTVIVYID